MEIYRNKVALLLLAAVASVGVYLFHASPAGAVGDLLSYTGRRPQVGFLENYHDLHMEEQDCLFCHHRYENGENVLDESELYEGNPQISCSACHDRQAGMDLQEAVHTQCMDCHDSLKKQGLVTGPLLCGECHTRKVTEE